ncbi:hypothetical protein FH972_025454 [Carpinus fangiana]|uniref:Uncharacterized protein n=1 Tax=Carpinus fangiana TaxID=176857 RepID=A0A5N6L1H2_9ROSI|nr:hypothetical protein FH972_025454 [Carpinus fangiana]
MGRTKQETKSKRSQKSSNQLNGSASADSSPDAALELLAQATEHLHTGQPDLAISSTQKAVTILSQPGLAPTAKLPALELLGEIYVELGDQDAARSTFTQAAALDPEGILPVEDGGGSDKFLWLAQLSEEGGKDSVGWFEKGCMSLRREITEGQAKAKDDEDLLVVAMNLQKLANALCGAAEVYMTDLSWEDDAEARSEALVSEACAVAPENPEPLQTLASVRISQQRMEEARSALTQSLELWSDLPPEDPDVPDFSTRISLSRLLMEAELEEKAIDVLDRLVIEDDSSVEAWYLGGWCLTLIAEKQAKAEEKMEDAEQSATLKSSRRWLRRALKLYAALEYEDDRLRDHAEELVAGLAKKLGSEEGDEDEEEEVWEGISDEDDDGDQEMQES